MRLALKIHGPVTAVLDFSDLIACGTKPQYHVPMRSLCVALVSLAFLLASDLPGQETPYSIEVRDRVVTISLRDDAGIPLKDLVKIANRITGKVFTFSAQEIEGVSVRLVGTVRVAQDRFFGFFQTILYIKGFACVIRGEGSHEVVELVRMRSMANS